MSATTHGSAALYSLVEQPGSSFTTTRGGFDTGRRVFKCWQSVAVTLEPLRGSSDETYSGMKVDTVTTTFDKAGVATLDVNYLGIKNQSQTKEDEVNYSVTSETPSFYVSTTSFDFNATIPKPQVTRTYLTRTLPTSKVGQFEEPVKYVDQVPGSTIYFGEVGLTLTFTFLFKGWKLIGRTIKNVGDLYEITETHQWDHQVETVSEA